mmetsp:Transcript_1833/g.2864  ORF Transcript_1833/g.2864 Transcript_1833/m.2864 type:complete len:266 (+) Transcript_1833:103-900(+)
MNSIPLSKQQSVMAQVFVAGLRPIAFLLAIALFTAMLSRDGDRSKLQYHSDRKYYMRRLCMSSLRGGGGLADMDLGDATKYPKGAHDLQHLGMNGNSEQIYRTRTSALSQEKIYELNSFVAPFFKTENWLGHTNLMKGAYVEAEYLYLQHQFRNPVIEEICRDFDKLAEQNDPLSPNKTRPDLNTAAGTITLTIPAETYAPLAMEERDHIRPNVTAVKIYYQFRPDKPIATGGHFRFVGARCVVHTRTGAPARAKLCEVSIDDDD